MIVCINLTQHSVHSKYNLHTISWLIQVCILFKKVFLHQNWTRDPKKEWTTSHTAKIVFNQNNVIKKTKPCDFSRLFLPCLSRWQHCAWWEFAFTRFCTNRTINTLNWGCYMCWRFVDDQSLIGGEFWRIKVRDAGCFSARGICVSCCAVRQPACTTIVALSGADPLLRRALDKSCSDSLTLQLRAITHSIILSQLIANNLRPHRWTTPSPFSSQLSSKSQTTLQLSSRLLPICWT